MQFLIIKNSQKKLNSYEVGDNIELNTTWLNY